MAPGGSWRSRQLMATSKKCRIDWTSDCLECARGEGEAYNKIKVGPWSWSCSRSGSGSRAARCRRRRRRRRCHHCRRCHCRLLQLQRRQAEGLKWSKFFRHVSLIIKNLFSTGWEKSLKLKNKKKWINHKNVSFNAKQQCLEPSLMLSITFWNLKW